MGFVELRGDLPINITADRMDAFQKENRVVFEGNVVVNQRDTYIYAQRISAELAPQELGGGIRKVVALKDVRITQKDRVATCDRAEFDNISRVIELSGNPKIWSGKDRIDGERVVIQLDQEKMTVVGSEDRRVSAVLYPKSRKAQRSPEEGPKEGIRPTFIAPFAPATDAVESPPAPKPPAEEEAPSMARAQTPEEETPTPPASSPPAPSPSPPPLPSEPQTAPVPPALYAEEQYAKIPSRLTGAEEGEGTPLPETQEVVERENAEPIPPSAPSAPPAEEEVDEVEVLAFLERWRSAWENKKLDAYMECYSRRFRSGGRDWKGWKDYKARLNRRYRFIRVEMEDVQVTANHEGLRVSFIQNYQSDRYKDRGRKILHLVREDGQWKILREEWKAL
jgi:lipopolysaccharide transport protein LptA